eukprot:CAMPEP_0201116354 /NCGR_PEP_ID=MMETSP0850-20130426/674_1 /ASSEMBLY_ACC=CAM_ASM_000622 /TAXON_ID=183588 /ORGANISM="Pseudo-nitzschia fraudulenta, Strain WWA7" /LENGTH=173 /DNA_ID=CAMNT_0047380421 /DNA_START=71 /DNA_END=592 /DNA_ORIENTATION=+
MSPIKFLLLTIAFTILVTSAAFTTTTPSRASNNGRNVALSFAPVDLPDECFLLLAKCDTKTALGMNLLKKVKTGADVFVDPDVQAQILNDGSHMLMDFPDVFRKPSKLQMKYLQVIGRIMILGTGMLPHHGFSHEELAVQLFLLNANLKPVIRSIQLYRCITKGRCDSECDLE